MPIIKGSTPTIKVVLSSDDIDFSSLAKVYLTFAQKGNMLSGPSTTFDPPFDPDQIDGKPTGTLTLATKLEQNQTLALIEDVDLDCQVDVLTLTGDRKVSKMFSFGVCKALRDTELSVE